MPKISEEEREARRMAILEAARRCFATHGYDGATVARLEEATGRSRGAIFNHFVDKLDLFVAVVEADTAAQLERIRAGGTAADVLRTILGTDPDWSTAIVEASRRRRTDAAFRARWDARRSGMVREALATLVERGRAAGRIREDVPADVLARVVSVVGDGLTLQRAILGDVPDGEAVVDFVESALAPPASDSDR